jgi:hypothetical protein
MAKPVSNSLIAMVTKEAGDNLLSYLKGLGKGVVSNRLKAMVASAEYVGTQWTKKKGESVLRALGAFDIKSEKQAKNYVNAGRVIIVSQMTEDQACKVGLSRIMRFATKLLEDEACATHKTIEVACREYEATIEKKKKEKEDALATAKAAKKQASVEDMKEFLEEAFDEEEGVTETRVWAHVTIHFDFLKAGTELKTVCGDNAHEGLTKLIALVKKEAKSMAEAERKAESEEKKNLESKAKKVASGKK